MADRKTQARNGYQDAADMAIAGRYRGPASSSTIPPVNTDETIVSSLEEIKNVSRRTFGVIREAKEKLLEGQRTIIVKEDKVLEALVRLKRPVYDDVEFERAQAINEFRMALMQEEAVVAQAQAMVAQAQAMVAQAQAMVVNEKWRGIRGIVIAASVGIVAILLAFGWVCQRLF